MDNKTKRVHTWPFSICADGRGLKAWKSQPQLLDTLKGVPALPLLIQPPKPSCTCPTFLKCLWVMNCKFPLTVEWGTYRSTKCKRWVAWGQTALRIKWVEEPSLGVLPTIHKFFQTRFSPWRSEKIASWFMQKTGGNVLIHTQCILFSVI